MAGNDTRKYSLDELREQRERGETETRPDAPLFSLEPEFWENARVVMPPPGKSSIHLRIDSDAVLRSFMEAHKRPHS